MEDNSSSRKSMLTSRNTIVRLDSTISRIKPNSRLCDVVKVCAACLITLVFGCAILLIHNYIHDYLFHENPTSSTENSSSRQQRRQLSTNPTFYAEPKFQKLKGRKQKAKETEKTNMSSNPPSIDDLRKREDLYVRNTLDKIMNNQNYFINLLSWIQNLNVDLPRSSQDTSHSLSKKEMLYIVYTPEFGNRNLLLGLSVKQMLFNQAHKLCKKHAPRGFHLATIGSIYKDVDGISQIVQQELYGVKNAFVIGSDPDNKELMKKLNPQRLKDPRESALLKRSKHSSITAKTTKCPVLNTFNERFQIYANNCVQNLRSICIYEVKQSQYS